MDVGLQPHRSLFVKKFRIDGSRSNQSNHPTTYLRTSELAARASRVAIFLPKPEENIPDYHKIIKWPLQYTNIFHSKAELSYFSWYNISKQEENIQNYHTII
jgi:hypothetical protein